MSEPTDNISELRYNLFHQYPMVSAELEFWIRQILFEIYTEELIERGGA